MLKLAPHCDGWEERLKSLADSSVTVIIMKNTVVSHMLPTCVPYVHYLETALTVFTQIFEQCKFHEFHRRQYFHEILVLYILEYYL